MKIIGLTGGVASGKNFVAEIFAQKGAVIFDADKEVHRLLDSDKSTISKVKKIFPESFLNLLQPRARILERTYLVPRLRRRIPRGARTY